MSLPSIIGEEEGEKFSIEVIFSNLQELIRFDPIKRTLTFIESQAKKVPEGANQL